MEVVLEGFAVDVVSGGTGCRTPDQSDKNVAGIVEAEIETCPAVDQGPRDENHHQGSAAHKETEE